MDHEVAIVDQDPAAFLGTLQPELVLAELLHLGVDLAGDGMALPPRVRGGDHEEVEQRGRLAEVEEEDVLGPVVVGDPGRDPGMLERQVDPVRVAPIDGLGGMSSCAARMERPRMAFAALRAPNRGRLLHRWDVLSHSWFPKSRTSAGGSSTRFLVTNNSRPEAIDLLDTPGTLGFDRPELECNRTSPS